MAKLGVPTSGTYNWRPSICSCVFAWLPQDGLELGPLNEVPPDFYEPCPIHEALSAEEAHRDAQERQLTWNMALCHVQTVAPDAMATMEVAFEGDGTMVVDAPDLGLDQKATLAEACNELVGPDRVMVR